MTIAILLLFASMPRKLTVNQIAASILAAQMSQHPVLMAQVLMSPLMKNQVHMYNLWMRSVKSTTSIVAGKA